MVDPDSFQHMQIAYLLFPATPVRNPAYSRNNTHLRMTHVAHGACMQMAEEVNQIQDSHDQGAPSDGNARQEIIDNLDFYHTIVEYIQDGVYFVDTDRKILFWNTGAENLTGYDKIATTGFYCFDNLLRHVDDSGEELCHDGCPLQATMQDGVPRQARVYLHHRQGHRVPVQVKTAATRNGAGEIVGGVEVFSDDSRYQMQRHRMTALEKMVHMDQLTELANRRLGHITLGQRMDEYTRYGWSFGLILADMVCRWGGEEFLIIAGNTGEEEIASLAERCHSLVASSTFEEAGQELSLTISAGATVFREGDDDAQSALDRADRFMYQCKREGKNCAASG